MKLTRKQIVYMSGAIGVVLMVVFIAFMMTRPQRTLSAFLSAVKAQDIVQAQQYVSADISEIRKENISFFLEDWTFSDTTVYVLGKEHAAWRSRDKITTVDGTKEIAKDTKGDPVKEIIPTTKHLAHFYEQYVTVAFDDYEDPVIIRLRRKGTDTWSRFAQIFRGWEIVDIDYQPSVEDDFENIDFDDGEDTDLEE